MLLPSQPLPPGSRPCLGATAGAASIHRGGACANRRRCDLLLPAGSRLPHPARACACEASPACACPPQEFRTVVLINCGATEFVPDRLKNAGLTEECLAKIRFVIIDRCASGLQAPCERSRARLGRVARVQARAHPSPCLLLRTQLRCSWRSDLHAMHALGWLAGQEVGPSRLLPGRQLWTGAPDVCAKRELAAAVALQPPTHPPRL